MHARGSRILISFLIVVAAYWTYSLVAVPLIEPQVRRVDKPMGTVLPPVPRHHLEGLLPPGSWEFDQPKVLETNEGMLFFKDYEPRDDGSISLSPLTLIMYPDGRPEDEGSSPTEAGSERQARPVIMRAPEGAVLRFEDRLDLTQARPGRLAGGVLMGEITIQSPESAPHAGDALMMHTRHVQIDRQRIWTTSAVDLQFGQSHGSGRDLVIQLGPVTGQAGDRQAAAPMGGVKSLELVHVDRIRLHLDGDRPLSREASAPTGGPARELNLSNVASAAQPTVVEVACRGPFRFDFQTLVARFERQVNVTRLHPNAPSDQLSCESLAIHLARRSDESVAESSVEGAATEPAAPEHNTGARWSELKLERVVADGRPVVLLAPSAGAAARGEHLEYNFRTGQIYLNDGNLATFEQAGRRIEAPQLEYEFDAEDPRRLSRLWASGPGRILVPRGSDDAPPLEAAWAKELRLLPQDDNRVLSLVSQARISQPGMGGLTADTIDLWLAETAQDDEARRSPQGAATDPNVRAAERQPPTLGQSAAWRGFRPVRMQAQSDVWIDSLQLSGHTNRLEIWFQRPEGAAPAEASAAHRQRPPSALAQGLERQDSQTPSEKYDLSGELVRVQLVLGEQTSIEKLTVQGKVRVRQLTASNPERPPVRIEGDVLQLDGIGSNDANGQVAGQPALISAGGLTVTSRLVQLAQGINRLWIDGAGDMALAPPSIAALRGVHRPQPTTIAWSGRMDFDGARARFERDVEARGLQLQKDGGANDVVARGGVLDVELTRRIDFVRPRQQTRVEARLFSFPDGAYVENRGYDKLGVLQSIDKLNARNLSINSQTGWLEADGPGRVSSVRRGQSPLLTAGHRSPPPQAQPSSSQLNYLQVDFVGGITGDLFKREVAFHNQVSVVYGPVADWHEQLDGRRREGLGERGVLLTCNLLKVAEMGIAAASGRSVELEAVDNTFIQGGSFTGSGRSIKYVQAKDRLVLEGDGRSDATLTYQATLGQKPATLKAGRIIYSLESGHFRLEEATSLNMEDLRSRSLFPQRTGSPHDAARQGLAPR